MQKSSHHEQIDLPSLPPTEPFVRMPKDFHTEEYKQLRTEVVGLVEKIDQYFKYVILVPTGVYSWLLATAFGTLTRTKNGIEFGVHCLKLPSELIFLAWLIPPAFVLFCGINTNAFNTRISQMGTYLTQLENNLGMPSLGWEKFNALLAPKLTQVRIISWIAILVTCIVASLTGISFTNMIHAICMAK